MAMFGQLSKKFLIVIADGASLVGADASVVEPALQTLAAACDAIAQARRVICGCCTTVPFLLLSMCRWWFRGRAADVLVLCCVLLVRASYLAAHSTHCNLLRRWGRC